tara:strand:- start:1029 stop:1175 length:147 start_codon:yes stop_codon:yes gene_type:complete
MKKKILIGSMFGATALMAGIAWKVKNVRMWKDIESTLPFPRAKKLGDK